MTEDVDLLAGEYVLGTLDAAERESAAMRRLADPAFDAAVVDWEGRLSSLDEVTVPVRPSADVWPSIVARIRAERGDRSTSATIARLEARLRRWKRAAQVATAVAAMLALWAVVAPVLSYRRVGPTLVAVLQPTGQKPAFLIRADLDSREMSINPLASKPPPGKSFQLWLIDPTLGAPQSLGLLHGGDALHPAVSGLTADVLARATYAVTIEPEGGAPTGQATSPPVYTGHLLNAGL